MAAITHVPVLLNEVIEGLDPKRGGIYVDGTVGLGGHAEAVLSRILPGGILIGIDKDGEALSIARDRLGGYGKAAYLIKGDFYRMAEIVRNTGFAEVDGILLDLGVSSLQLFSEDRGFSFRSSAPLDMRMDKAQDLTAWDVVNKYPEGRLEEIIRAYGEERYARRIVRAVVRNRPIDTCLQLSALIDGLGIRSGRIHPATRTFQALRIEVNMELDNLSSCMSEGVGILKKGGRFCVISYHSLEDRVVKNSFRDTAKQGIMKLITKKPLRPTREELGINPSSRSARLRVAERM